MARVVWSRTGPNSIRATVTNRLSVGDQAPDGSGTLLSLIATRWLLWSGDRGEERTIDNGGNSVSFSGLRPGIQWWVVWSGVWGLSNLASTYQEVASTSFDWGASTGGGGDGDGDDDDDTPTAVPDPAVDPAIGQPSLSLAISGRDIIVTTNALSFEYRTSARGAWQSGGSVSGGKGTISNFRYYTRYYVRARLSSGGKFGRYATADIRTPSTVPDAPRQATLRGCANQIRAEATVPYSYGLAITSFDFRVRAAPAGAWSDIQTTNAPVSTFTGLVTGTEYQVQVRARNSLGVGAWSISFSTRPINPRRPDAPRDTPLVTRFMEDILAAVLEGFDGCSEILRYGIRYQEAGATSWTELSQDIATYIDPDATDQVADRDGAIQTARSFLLQNLKAGSNYYVQGRVGNVYGWSLWSPAATIAAITFPNAPGREHLYLFADNLNTVSRLTSLDDPASAEVLTGVLPSQAGSATSTNISGATWDIDRLRFYRTTTPPQWWTETPTDPTSYALLGSRLPAGAGIGAGQSLASVSDGAGDADMFIATSTGIWQLPDEVERRLANATRVYDTSTEFNSSAGTGMAYYRGALYIIDDADVSQFLRFTDIAGFAGSKEAITGLVTPPAPWLGVGGMTVFDNRLIVVGYNDRTVHEVVFDGTTASFQLLGTLPTTAGSVKGLATAYAPPTVNPFNQGMRVQVATPDFDGGSAVTAYQTRYRLATATTWTNVDHSPATSLFTQIMGLTNGSAYRVQSRARNELGWSVWTEAVEVTPVNATVPGVPSFNIIRGDEQLTISIGSPDDGGSPITHFNVGWRDRNVGGIFNIFRSTGNTPIIGGLTNGVPYQVRVQAVNVVGPSDWSGVQFQRPFTVPATPIITRIAVTETTAAVTSEVPHDGGRRLQTMSYQIRGQSPVVYHTFAGNRSGDDTEPTTANLTGLTQGQMYEVRVIATNQAGSTESEYATFYPSAFPSRPAAPTLEIGDRLLVANAVAPAGNGSAIEGYTFRHTSDIEDIISDKRGWWLTLDDNKQPTASQITGDGHAFTGDRFTAFSNMDAAFWIIVPYAVDDLEYFGETTATSQLIALNNFLHRFTLVIMGETFYAYGTDPGYTAGSISTDWRVDGTPGTRTQAQDNAIWSEQVEVTSPRQVLFNLVNGTRYAVEVKARNMRGDSTWSEPAVGTPLASNLLPGTPAAPTITPTSEQLVATVTPPSSPTAINQYLFFWRIAGSGVPFTEVRQAGAALTLTGLTNGVRYEIAASVRNSAGLSHISNSAIGIPADKPSFPTFAVSSRRSRLLLRDIQSESNGASITTMDVNWRLAAGRPGARNEYTGTIADLPGTFYGDAYFSWQGVSPFDVVVNIPKNEFGETPPPQLAYVSVVIVGGTTSDVQLTRSGDTATTWGYGRVFGSPALPVPQVGVSFTLRFYSNVSYTIPLNVHPGWAWTNATVPFASTYETPTLSDDTIYHVRVRTRNAIGDSQWSDTLSATVVDNPSAPQVSMQAANTGGIGTITPPDYIPEAIASYNYRYRPALSTDAYMTGSTTSTRFMIINLANGLQYAVQVQAVTGSSVSEWSAEVIFTPSTVPSAAATLLTPSDRRIAGQIVIGNIGGSPLDTWEYQYRRGISGTWTEVQITSENFTIFGLLNDVSYQVRSRGRNANGWGPWGQIAFATPFSTGFAAGFEVRQNSLSVMISSTARGRNLTYSYDMGDGRTITGMPDIQHVYNQPGVYIVTQTVRLGSLEDTARQNVSVRLTSGYVVELDINWNGLFDHSGSDVSEYTTEASWAYGMNNSYDMIASPSACTIALVDTRHWFNEITGIEPYREDLLGMMVRVRWTNPRGTENQIQGWITDVQPDERRNATLTTISFSDKIQELSEHEYAPIFSQNVLLSVEIENIFNSAALQYPYTRSWWIVGHSRLGISTRIFKTTGIDIEESQATIRWTGNADEAGEGVRALSYLADLLFVELGARIYTDREGRFVFKNRRSDFLAPVRDVFTSSEYNDYTYNQQEIVNSVTVNYYPRRILTPRSTIYRLQNAPIRLNNQESRTFTARYFDPDNPDASVAATDIITPVDEVDIIARNMPPNQLEDGTPDLANPVGDPVDDLAVDFVAGADSAEVTVTNTDPDAPGVDDFPFIYIYKFDIRGTPIAAYQPEEVTVRNAASIARYGLKDRGIINLRFIDTIEDAELYARLFLFRSAFTTQRFESISFTLETVGLDSEALKLRVLSRQIGDVIRVTNEVTSHDKRYLIVGESHTIIDGEHSVNWTLRQLLSRTVWILGTARLGEDTVLAI